MWFFFALASVALPIAALLLENGRRLRRAWMFSLGSFVCFACMCMDELFTIRRRCFSGDFGGIEDTIGAVLLISGAAAVAVVLLNALALGIAYEKE